MGAAPFPYYTSVLTPECHHRVERPVLVWTCCSEDSPSLFCLTSITSFKRDCPFLFGTWLDIAKKKKNTYVSVCTSFLTTISNLYPRQVTIPRSLFITYALSSSRCHRLRNVLATMLERTKSISWVRSPRRNLAITKTSTTSVQDHRSLQLGQGLPKLASHSTIETATQSQSRYGDACFEKFASPYKASLAILGEGSITRLKHKTIFLSFEPRFED